MLHQSEGTNINLDEKKNMVNKFWFTKMVKKVFNKMNEYMCVCV